MAVDTTRPSVGRIYDFMLGGHHNYEVDRQAAAGILKVFPAYPRWARLNRWFLQYAAAQWAEQGRARILDVASGLPTQGHVLDFLPDARVLFTDNDPLSVAYGQEILKGRANTAYREADVRAPEKLLEHATQFFGDAREVAIGAIGIVYFLGDEEVRALMRRLHAWAAPGSVLALSYMERLAGAPGDRFDQLNDLIERFIGVRVVPRTNAQLAELAAPWRLVRAEPLQRLLDASDMFDGLEMGADGAVLSGAFFAR